MTADNDRDQLEFGVQPLDGILSERGLVNHDLVAASKEPLTHKMVAKGRKGRRLTIKLQKRVVAALNGAVGEREYTVDEAFTYRGK